MVESGSSMRTGQLKANKFYIFTKRTFDIVFSIVVMSILLIPMLVLCAAIILESPGNPIYADERIGQYGRKIKVYKLRTMVADAWNVEKYFTENQLSQWKCERKVSNDPRITRLGGFLRKTSLDEFPQFVNVLIGNMSVIGPRPITEDELEWFGDNKERLLSVKPGITGWWQVTARNRATYEDGFRQEIELQYVDNASFLMDARIFIGTFGAILSKTGQ